MLANKTLAVVIALFIILFGWFFLSTNSSYQLSFKAKFYYEIGEFKRSYELSKQAYDIDVYNNMAFTILKRSESALRLKDYISRGDEYMGKIRQIAKSDVRRADRERIRLMCDIMIDDFEQVFKGALDKSLLEDAKNTRDSFKRLRYELFGS